MMWITQCYSWSSNLFCFSGSRRCLWPEAACPVKVVARCLQGVCKAFWSSLQTPLTHPLSRSLERCSNKLFFQVFLNPSILAAFCVINSQDKKVIQLSARIQNILFTRVRVRDYRNNCHSTFISCQVPVLVLPQTTSHTVNPMNGQ